VPWAFPGGVLHNVPEMSEGNTVDGSEIQHPPVDMENISSFTGISYIAGGCLGFLNHQQ